MRLAIRSVDRTPGPGSSMSTADPLIGALLGSETVGTASPLRSFAEITHTLRSERPVRRKTRDFRYGSEPENPRLRKIRRFPYLSGPVSDGFILTIGISTYDDTTRFEVRAQYLVFFRSTLRGLGRAAACPAKFQDQIKSLARTPKELCHDTFSSSFL